jgi:5-methyltetrahydropteroyltriglutamate--homocysteine methyltransferase
LLGIVTLLIPTEPIGSIPRPAELFAAMQAHVTGQISMKKSAAPKEDP